MKAPILPKFLSLSRDPCLGPYPPKGFLTFEQCEGEDVYYGLYWPLGKEGEDPLVCLTTTGGRYFLDPAFSSLDRFMCVYHQFEFVEPDPLKELPNSLSGRIENWEPELPEDPDERAEWKFYDVIREFPEPTLEEDAHSPIALFDAAQAEVSEGNFDSALTKLRLATEVLPEFTGAWSLLCTIHLRQRYEEEAVKAALMAMIGPLCFGGPHESVIKCFQQMRIPPALENDPILKRRADMRLSFGGNKTNDDYKIMSDCIHKYFELGQPINAIMLHQRYAALMLYETTAFQERYGFSLADFDKQQTSYFERFFHDSRITASG